VKLATLLEVQNYWYCMPRKLWKAP